MIIAAVFVRLDSVNAVPALAARNDLRFIDVHYFIALYVDSNDRLSIGVMCQVSSMKLPAEAHEIVTGHEKHAKTRSDRHADAVAFL